MKYLRLSEKAVSELEQIHERIAEHDPYRADTFIEELKSHMDMAALFPLAGPQIPGGEKHERFLSHGDYIITYTVGPERVFVTGVMHAAQDITALH